MEQIRTAIYARVSTKDQADEGYSIEAQLEKMRLYCQSKEWMIYDEYIDAGISGATLERPALQKMIKDCEAGKFNMVLVYKLDRLSRSQKGTLYLIEDVFHPNNVKFSSIQENFDTSTAFGMAMVGILSVFAQLERSQIADRMQMGRDERAKSGLYHGGGNVPIGYDYDINSQMLVINEYEALQVKEVFRLFAAGETIQSIRNYMHKHYTNKYGSYTTSKTIRSILTNPTYAGMIRHGNDIYAGVHEPIFEKAYFEKIQKLYKIHCETCRKPTTTPFARTTLLSGMIYCGKCGARYGGQAHQIKKGNCSKNYPIYACYTRRGNKNMATADRCDNKNWKRAELEQIIWDEVLKLSIEFENDNTFVLQAQDKQTQIELIEKKIKQLDTQILKIMELYSLGTIPIDMIGAKLQSFNDDKEMLLDELDEIENNQNEINIEEVTEYLKSAQSIKEKGTPAEQKVLLEYLIERIVLNEERIEIHWTFE